MKAENDSLQKNEVWDIVEMSERKTSLQVNDILHLSETVKEKLLGKSKIRR